MLDRRLRDGVQRGLTPVGTGLRRLGVSANVLTIAGLVASVVTAWLIATGRLWWAVLGVVASGLLDVLDGTVARGSGNAGPRGSFFDSVADRVSDALLLGGVAWYLADQSPYLPVLAFAVAAVSATISYERAKGEALGFTAKGGLLERAERLILLGVGLAFDVLVPVLWIMLVLGAWTTLHRFVMVWRQAGPPRTPRVRLRRRGTTGDRDTLRQWWEARRPAGSRRRSERTRSPRRTRP